MGDTGRRLGKQGVGQDKLLSPTVRNLARMPWPKPSIALFPSNPYASDQIVVGPRVPVDFLIDNFVGPNNRTIDAHTSDSGTGWIVSPATPTGANPNILNNNFRSSTGSIKTAVSAAQPFNADYYVEGNLLFLTSNPTNISSFCGRIDATTGNCYCAGYSVAAGGYILSKLINNVRTQLGSTVVVAYPASSTHLVRLTMLGTTISMDVDGVRVLDVTDSSITTAGNPGFNIIGGSGSGTTAIHLTDMKANG